MPRAPRQPTQADHDAIAQAQRREQAGDLAEAQAAYEALAKKFSDQPDIHFAIGHILLQRADFEAALGKLDRAIRLDARKPHYHAIRGLVLSALSRIEAGIAAADRALAIDPNHPTGLYVKAELLRLDGRAAEAYRMLVPRIESLPDQPDLAGAFAQSALSTGHADEARVVVERALERESLPDAVRAGLLFRLGSILDKAGEHDDAFTTLAEANRLKGVRYDPDRERSTVESRIEAWSAERLARLPRARESSELPIFIVGMPRSGTTLVEQVLASHSRVFGAGEANNVPRAGKELMRRMESGATEADCLDALAQPAIDRVARRELREMKRLARGADRLTDKMMTNFRFLGLIELLFPAARIVHCTRDPLDTCISCFFHDFSNSQPYTYDLAHLGGYYLLYERLMAHWKSVVKLPMLEVAYENMVSDQEVQSRRLIEFVGLDWEDACLRFHETKREVVTHSTEQVRKPMYASSVKRHTRYERHLGPLKEALGLG